MKVSEGLQQARNILASEGWVTGTNHNERGYCARGAINKVFLGNPNPNHTEEFDPGDLLGFTQLVLRYGMYRHWLEADSVRRVVSDLWRWNDRFSGRKKKNVLAAFDRAIAEAQRIEEDSAAAFMEQFTTIPGLIVDLSEPEPEVVERSDDAMVVT